jgi:hypothetical protein
VLLMNSLVEITIDQRRDLVEQIDFEVQRRLFGGFSDKLF